MANKSDKPNPRKEGTNTMTAKAGATRSKNKKHRPFKNGGKLK